MPGILISHQYSKITDFAMSHVFKFQNHTRYSCRLLQGARTSVDPFWHKTNQSRTSSSDRCCLTGRCQAWQMIDIAGVAAFMHSSGVRVTPQKRNSRMWCTTVGNIHGCRIAGRLLNTPLLVR